MNADEWDERYRGAELVWSAGPNQFLVQEVADLAPGTALDVACGEGRNALWLAEQGWTATGADFSPVAIEKARAIADRRGVDVDFRVADATQPVGDGPFDLVVVFYLHLPAEQRTASLRAAAAAVAPGGTLLVVGHDLDNLERGVGGPPSPEVLLTPDRVTGDLEGTGLVVERAQRVTRDVPQEDGSQRQAIDCLVRASRP